MKYKTIYVPLSSINLKDTSFKITTQTDNSLLKLSVNKLGLMSYPMLLGNADSGFKIISGFRRVQVSKELAWADLPVNVADSKTTKQECVNFAIIDNTFQRPLNFIEMSKAFNMLSEFYQNDADMAKAASELGLPDNYQLIKKVLPICNMSKSLQKGILTDAIALPTALELNAMNNKDGDFLAKLFTDFKLSLSKQREILSFVKDISLRDNISILDIFYKQDIQDILQNLELDKNQIANKLRIYLKKCRFPNIVKAEKAFGSNVKKLNLGQNIKLIPPKNFEGTIYTMNLNFKNIEELKLQKAVLDKIVHEPILDKILAGEEF